MSNPDTPTLAFPSMRLFQEFLGGLRVIFYFFSCTRCNFFLQKKVVEPHRKPPLLIIPTD
jgi:hypothetical protein